MPPHSWDDLYKAIRKGVLPPAVYLHGSEEPLKDELITELLDKALDPDLRDFNLDHRSASSLQPEDVATLLTTLPMMADRRVVVIRDVEAWNKKARAKQAVLDCLAKPSPETLLILVQNAGDKEKPKENDADPDLARRAYTVNCERLPFDRAVRWVTARAEKLGLAIVPAAVEHMVKVWDCELGPLRTELDKLLGLSGGEPLGIEQVSASLGVRQGETVPDWRDAVMNGDTGRAVAMLPSLLGQSGVTGVKLVTTLGTALVGTAMARGLCDQGKRGRALESAVFDGLKRARLWGIDYKSTAALWSRWAARWTAPRLQDAIRATIEADMSLKDTTISDPNGILADLVMRMADQRKAAA